LFGQVELGLANMDMAEKEAYSQGKIELANAFTPRK